MISHVKAQIRAANNTVAQNPVGGIKNAKFGKVGDGYESRLREGVSGAAALLRPEELF